jgi:hypothetical protein
MATTAERNFVLQQGLPAPDVKSCPIVSSALLFQPRLVGLILIVGVLSQSPVVFAALGALLWWSALLPRLNPFDHAYNHTLGRRPGTPALGPAPMPRRFAQGMAATFVTAIAACLAADLRVAAWVLQALLVLAVAALVLGRLCLGSFVYHLVRGRVAFAMAALPWARTVRSVDPPRQLD